MSPYPSMSPRHRRTLYWVVGLGAAGLTFDAYDLVVYGSFVPIFLRDPSQLGPVSPELAGAMGSAALAGVLVGALLAGAVGDRVGRRRIMLTAYVWFSLGMALTALTTTTTLFGVTRFLTGMGVGAVLATTAAIVNEFAPAARKNFYVGITYAGGAFGGVAAGLLAALLLDVIGWRGMLLIGAIPLVTLVPLAWFRMPESVEWLVARGRVAEAQAVAARTGVPLPSTAGPAVEVPAGDDAPLGFRGLFRPGNLRALLLIGLVAAAAQVLLYSLTTWLPELMGQAGFSPAVSRLSLVALGLGSVAGSVLGGRLADRIGPKALTAAAFALVAVTNALIGIGVPGPVLAVLLVLTGLGAGACNAIYGYAAVYFVTSVRAAAVSWTTSSGRAGSIVGPVGGGVLVGSGLALNSIFFVVAGASLLGVAATLLIPRRRAAAPAVPAISVAEPVAADAADGPESRV